MTDVGAPDYSDDGHAAVPADRTDRAAVSDARLQARRARADLRAPDDRRGAGCTRRSRQSREPAAIGFSARRTAPARREQNVEQLLLAESPGRAARPTGRSDSITRRPRGRGSCGRARAGWPARVERQLDVVFGGPVGHQAHAAAGREHL